MLVNTFTLGQYVLAPPRGVDKKFPYELAYGGLGSVGSVSRIFDPAVARAGGAAGRRHPSRSKELVESFQTSGLSSSDDPGIKTWVS